MYVQKIVTFIQLKTVIEFALNVNERAVVSPRWSIYLIYRTEWRTWLLISIAAYNFDHDRDLPVVLSKAVKAT